MAAGEAAGKEYIANHYHQPADEWQASWTFAGMSHDLGVLYKLGSDLANSREWPNWSADSEFRADARRDGRGTQVATAGGVASCELRAPGPAGLARRGRKRPRPRQRRLW